MNLLLYLGIAVQEDLDIGVHEASYILCRNPRPQDKYTSYMVRAADEDLSTMILFNSAIGNEEAIAYMSWYRAREPMGLRRGVETTTRRHFMPVGELNWYPCNKYGERLRSQPVIFIKRVPDPSMRVRTDGQKDMIQELRSRRVNPLIHGVRSRHEVPFTPLPRGFLYGGEIAVGDSMHINRGIHRDIPVNDKTKESEKGYGNEEDYPNG